VGCSVLIVDDDPNILATVADVLSWEGYPIRTACDGQEALAEVARECPHIVLLDMRMPVLDGWGFAEAVASQRKDLKIVVMTAAINARTWAEQIAADGYLAKPFDIDRLLGEVHRLCPAPA
jgi:two-component system, chemotaxis family, chemotaxis protein CheY